MHLFFSLWLQFFVVSLETVLHPKKGFCAESLLSFFSYSS